MERLAVESSSDGEEMQSLTAAPMAVPYEVRAARRAAVAALISTALCCLCCVGVVVHRSARPAATGEPAATAAVGLSQVETSVDPQTLLHEEMSGLLAETRALQYGTRPAPYHLAAPSALRVGASEDSAVERNMAAGVQVFPLSHHGEWIQVVVPKAALGGSVVNATFGWLPERSADGETLLVQDSESDDREQSHWRQVPPTSEQVQEKWDQVRAKNTDLKRQIAHLQTMMQSSYPAPVAAQQEASETDRREAVKQQVGEVIDVHEMSKTFKQVHVDLKQELKSPKDFFAKLGRELAK